MTDKKQNIAIHTVGCVVRSDAVVTGVDRLC